MGLCYKIAILKVYRSRVFPSERQSTWKCCIVVQVTFESFLDLLTFIISSQIILNLYKKIFHRLNFLLLVFFGEKGLFPLNYIY